MFDTTHDNRHAGKPIFRCCTFAGLLGACVVSAAPDAAQAASVRVWSAAVVVTDDIHLSDVCELRGFDADLERVLRDTTVMPAPAPGQSVVLPQRTIREALRASDVNMALVTVGGAARCEVSRPDRRSLARTASTPHEPSRTTGATASAPPGASSSVPPGAISTESTLRSAVIQFFHRELARYRGRADVTFDRSAQQMLELSSPPYTFQVRRRGSSPLGLVAVEVDVLTDRAVVQTVPLVAQVALARDVVVARRAINQGATVGAADVETTPLRFGRVEALGLLDADQIIGQRAKRFISSGSMIELPDVESVPIVVRGQLITLVSVVGGIEVMTTGKAADDGLFGDTIRVRAADNRRVEFDAVVIGPARARVGAVPAGASDSVDLARAGS